jgi:hypothetical protein
MPATMKKKTRNEAILNLLVLNEQSHELGRVVGEFRENASEENKETAADLARFADSYAFDVREKILDLVRQNLGPQQQRNLMLVLKKTGEWLDEERAALQPRHFPGLRVMPGPKDACRLRDLDHFEMFLRKLARDILRAMADYNFRQRMAG